MDKSQLLGSTTAKNGFKNEKNIATKFNSWKTDEDARKWLSIMQYDLNEIEKVEAIILPNKYKSDIQVKVSIILKDAISAENISIKLVSNLRGFNQIDKRWVDDYTQMWNIPKKIETLLKQFTGEITHNDLNRKEQRRAYLDEFSIEQQTNIINFFEENKLMIVTDLLKGRDRLSADWFMVAQKVEKNQKWTLNPISYVLNFFGNGPVFITNRGSLRIGKITMQRKGGDNGRKTAQMLQFKINPAELFKI